MIQSIFITLNTKARKKFSVRSGKSWTKKFFKTKDFRDVGKVAK